LDETTAKKPETFTDWVRIKLKNVLDAIAGFSTVWESTPISLQSPAWLEISLGQFSLVLDI